MQTVVPTTHFQHGADSFVDGVPVDVPPHIATELEAAGLVRVKVAPVLQNKMASEPKKK